MQVFTRLKTAILLFSIGMISYTAFFLVTRNSGFVFMNQMISNQKVHLPQTFPTSHNPKAAQNDTSSSRSFGIFFTLYKDPNQARNFWQNVPDATSELKIFGKKEYAQQNYDSAILFFNQAVLEQPADGDSYYWIGLSQMKIGNFAEAEKHFNLSVSATEKHEIGTSDAYHQMSRAIALQSVPTDWKIAEPFLEKALEFNDFQVGGSVATKFNKGEVLRHLNQVDAAIDEYERVVSESPNHYMGRVMLGNLLWRRKGDFENAQVALYEATKIAPKGITAFLELGDLHLAEGSLQQASDIYRYVLTLDPQNQRAQKGLEAAN